MTRDKMASARFIGGVSNPTAVLAKFLFCIPGRS